VNRTKINGTRLKTLLVERGIGQRELAQKVGVTHYSVNRWCKKGNNVVDNGNLTRMAGVLGMTLPDLVKSINGNEKSSPAQSALTAAESDFLNAYRALPPLEQAKLRVAVDELMKHISR